MTNPKDGAIPGLEGAMAPILKKNTSVYIYTHTLILAIWLNKTILDSS